MDFILSLTHFCEVHGPTSILCTQVQPFSCAQCYPEPSTPSPTHAPSTSQQSSLRQDREVGNSLSTNFSTATTSVDHTPSIESHPNFVHGNSNTDAEKYRYGSIESDTCASCSFTLPEDISKRLPAGAPGSPRADGKGRNGSPVLRSREVVHSCGSEHSDFDDDIHDPNYHPSMPGSVQSYSSSDSSCHTHPITYLSSRGPHNPADYALLRRSSIRTLSCELLPRGLSSGPLSFGDAVAGYTIAYIFRLPDSKARGRRRTYALVALAGKDSGRAFRACPLIWRAFGSIASGIVAAAERFQEAEKRRDEGEREAKKVDGRTYTPVSSFLTGRTVDPDGQPRRGQIRSKSLAEIVDNEYVFAELHVQFVAMLQQLGSMLGGLPISEDTPRSAVRSEGKDPERQAVVSTDEHKAAAKIGHIDDGSDGLDIAGLVISPKSKPTATDPILVPPRPSVMV